MAGSRKYLPPGPLKESALAPDPTNAHVPIAQLRQSPARERRPLAGALYGFRSPSVPLVRHSVIYMTNINSLDQLQLQASEVNHAALGATWCCWHVLLPRDLRHSGRGTEEKRRSQGGEGANGASRPARGCSEVKAEPPADRALCPSAQAPGACPAHAQTQLWARGGSGVCGTDTEPTEVASALLPAAVRRQAAPSPVRADGSTADVVCPEIAGRQPCPSPSSSLPAKPEGRTRGACVSRFQRAMRHPPGMCERSRVETIPGTVQNFK